MRTEKKSILKRNTFALLLLLSTTVVFAQEVKKENETVKTKMDAFSSRTGTTLKFTDSFLPDLKASYGNAETRIRKIKSGTTSTFFYQIEKAGKYSRNVASIEYSDLLELIKALNSLKADVDGDIEKKPDYLENKFVTVDGFQIGYYASKGKAQWYVKLEKYGSDNTLFIDNIEMIQTAFNEAKSKIEELKKSI